MLLSQSIRNDDQEELHNWLVRISGLLLCFGSLAWYIDLHVVLEVRIDSILEVFNLGSVVKRNDISVINEDIEAILLRERVKLVLEVLSVFDVLFETEDSPLLEIYGLAHDLSENVGVIESLACWLESALCLGSREHEDAWSLKDFCLNLIGLKV